MVIITQVNPTPGLVSSAPGSGSTDGVDNSGRTPDQSEVRQDPGSDEGALSTWLIVVIVAAVVALLAGVFYCMKTRRKPQGPSGGTATEPPASVLSMNPTFPEDHHPYGVNLNCTDPVRPPPAPGVSIVSIAGDAAPGGRPPIPLPSTATVTPVTCAWHSADRKCKQQAAAGNFCRSHACPTCKGKTGKSSSEAECYQCKIYGAPDLEGDSEYEPAPGTAASEHVYATVEDQPILILNDAYDTATDHARPIPNDAYDTATDHASPIPNDTYDTATDHASPVTDTANTVEYAEPTDRVPHGGWVPYAVLDGSQRSGSIIIQSADDDSGNGPRKGEGENRYEVPVPIATTPDRASTLGVSAGSSMLSQQGGQSSA